jgi:peroxiredoxin
MRSRFAPPGIAIALVALGLVVAPDHPAAKEPIAAPRFEMTDVEGRKISLDASRRSGPVLIDFWATWCKPCVESLPELERLHQKYGARGLHVIGISVDGPRNFSKVRPFAATHGISYPVAIDQDGRLQQLYRVIAVPTLFVVDTAGTIATVRVAYRAGEGAELEKMILGLLPAEADTARGSSAPADSVADH